MGSRNSPGDSFGMMVLAGRLPKPPQGVLGSTFVQGDSNQFIVVREGSRESWIGPLKPGARQRPPGRR